MWSHGVRGPIVPPSWGTTAILRLISNGSSLASCPSTDIFPLVGISCVAAILRKVVFPAPLRPRRVKISPRPIDRVISERACVLERWKIFDREMASIAFKVISHHTQIHRFPRTLLLLKSHNQSGFQPLPRPQGPVSLGRKRKSNLHAR